MYLPYFFAVSPQPPTPHSYFFWIEGKKGYRLLEFMGFCLFLEDRKRLAYVYM